MSVILVGYRGSGKSTAGRRLADQLWYKFADTDEMVVGEAGKSIAEIFAQDGEGRFRDLEAGVVARAVGLADHVIALGGGALMRPESARAVEESGHRVIYLRCEADELMRRIAADPATAKTRPALTGLGSSIEEIKTLLAQREPVYRRVMDAELDVTRLTPEEAANYIVRLM